MTSYTDYIKFQESYDKMTLNEYWAMGDALGDLPYESKSVARDMAALSRGVIAQITGYTTFPEQDKFLLDWFNWLATTLPLLSDWKEAFIKFLDYSNITFPPEQTEAFNKLKLHIGPRRYGAY